VHSSNCEKADGTVEPPGIGLLNEPCAENKNACRPTSIMRLGCESDYVCVVILSFCSRNG
jgi:hypothetical protein